MENKDKEILETKEEISQDTDIIEAPKEKEDNIIEVNNISMEFFLPEQKVDNLKEFFIRLVKGKMEKKKRKVL